MTQVTRPTHWAFLEAALIRSIHEGLFFDKKYWARHSSAGDVLKPVYLASTVMHGRIVELNKCVSRFLYWRAAVLSASSGEIPRGTRSFRR